MKKILITMTMTATALLLFVLCATPAHAAPTNCYCYTDLSKIRSSDLSTGTDNRTYNECIPSGDACASLLPDLKKSYPNTLYLTCNDLKYEEADCSQKKAQWTAGAVKTAQQLRNYEKAFNFTGSLVPSCLFDTVLTEQCRDVSVFVQLLINWGTSSFAILGTFALVFFIYGGLVLLLSRGNPEQIKKGTDIILASVLGVAVAFVAYIFVKALGETVGVKKIYNLSYLLLLV